MSFSSESRNTFGSGDFRRIVGHLASGVTVITTLSDDGQDAGMTASSVTSLSADPPMMLACLNNAVPTARAVGQTGAYVINVLGEGQGELALRFAKPSPDKFLGLRLDRTDSGLPIISDAIAHLECRVTEQVVGGTHTVYMGEVLAGKTQGGRPLTYFQGGFGRFEFAHNDEVYSALRQMVIDRTFHPDDTLDVTITAQRNGMEEAGVFYAFTRLAAEGLLNRDANRGYVVRAFDERISAEAFDARMMLQREALATGAVVNDGLPAYPELRRALAQMFSAIDGDMFRDFPSYVDGNVQFHRGIVALSGQSTMLSLYDSLNLRAVLLRSFGAIPETSSRFLVVQQQVLEALESADVGRAASHLQTYADMAKRRVSEVLTRTGGVI